MYKLDDIKLEQALIAGRKTRLAKLGEGEPVLLVHGWPECWYSWRHQIVALANAGYQVVAPDMPGYGGTESFAAIEDFNITQVSQFLIDVLTYCEFSKVNLIGHDWGSTICWYTTLLHPRWFLRLVTLSVPLRYHTRRPPMEIIKEQFAGDFFYQLYFQEPGVAEGEFDQDPQAILSRLYCSPKTPRKKPLIESSRADAGGWIGRLGEPLALPSWLSQEDLDYYVAEFSRTGFAGGINYYRNIDRNWEITGPYATQLIAIPVLFLAGEDDMVIRRASKEDLQKMMSPRVTNLTVELLPMIGHWIQQEAVEETNQAILGFLKDESANH